jgi:hypothetical protein
MSPSWRPLYQRLGYESVSGLVEGVPGHLWRPLTEWFESWVRPEDVSTLALRLKVVLPPAHHSSADSWPLMSGIDARADREKLLLEAVDGLLHMMLRYPSRYRRAGDAAASLERILEDGGSIWRVGRFGNALERRLDDSVAQALDDAAAKAPATAADHLRAARDAIYSLHPDAKRGYDEAILALEAITGPVVLPNDSKRTLGKVIAHMRDTKWKLAVNDQPANTIVDLMDLLWRNQPRHAPGDTPTRKVTTLEAETALHLAAHVVHLFATGAVTRAPI